VAARAGLRRGDRDARVEIELFAERSLFWRVGIFLREWNCRGPLILRLQRIESGGSFLAEIDAAGLADDRRTKRDGGKAEHAETRCGNSGGKQHRSCGNEFSHTKQPQAMSDCPRLNSTIATRFMSRYDQLVKKPVKRVAVCPV
jgi:hypothetical protein